MSERPNIHSIKLAPNDLELANGYKARIGEILAEACKLRDEAKRDGLQVDFGFGQDSFGRTTVTITVIKPLV
jgi:hypothetical protein